MPIKSNNFIAFYIGLKSLKKLWNEVSKKENYGYKSNANKRITHIEVQKKVIVHRVGSTNKMVPFIRSYNDLLFVSTSNCAQSSKTGIAAKKTSLCQRCNTNAQRFFWKSIFYDYKVFSILIPFFIRFFCVFF